MSEAVMEVRVRTRQAKKNLDSLRAKGNLVARDIEKIGKGGSLGRVGKDARRSSGQVDTLTRSTNSLSSRLLNLKNVILGGVITGLISGTATAIDGYKNVNSLLKIVTTSSKQYLGVQKDLFSLSQDTYSSIDNTTRLYAGQSKQLEALNFQQKDQLKVVELFNKALATSGSTVAESSSATLQWVQALGSGVLRGQEFNSIMENGRGVAIALADGLKVNIGNLRNMALEGKLSAKTVVDALLSQEGAIRNRFSQIPVTIGRAWQQLRNSTTVTLSKINTSLGDVTGNVAKLIQKTSKFIDTINIDKLITSIKFASLVITTLFVPSIVKAGLAMTLAFAKNPLGLVLTGIAIASVKLYEFADDTVTVGKRTATVADFVGGSWDYIKDRVSIAIDVIDEKWSSLTEGMTDRSVWDILLSFTKFSFNTIIATAISVKDLIVSTWNTLPDDFNIIGLKVTKVWITTKNTVLGTFLSLKNGVKEIMSDILSTLSGEISNTADSIRSVAPDTASNLDNASLGLLKKRLEIRRSVVSEEIEFNEKYKSSLGEVEDKISTLTDKVSLQKKQLSDKIDGNYEVDYLGEAYKGLSGIIDEVGKKAEERKLKRISESLEGTPPLLKSTSDGLSNAKGEVKELTKAEKELIKSQDSLKKGYESEIATLDRRLFAINANKNELLAYDLAQKTFGKNNLKFTESQIKEIALRSKNISLLEDEKAKKEKLVEANKSLAETIENQESDVIKLDFQAKAVDSSLSQKEQERATALAEVAAIRQDNINKGLNVTLANQSAALARKKINLEFSTAATIESNDKNRELKETLDKKELSLQNTLQKLRLLPDAYRKWKNAQDLAKGSTNETIISMEGQIEAMTKAKSAQSNFINALSGGKEGVKSYFENLRNEALKALATLALFGKGGSGGILGGLFGGGGGGIGSFVTSLFSSHTGSIVGQDSKHIGRLPKMHSGGIVGSNEQLTILENKEGVFTPAQMKALAPVGNSKKGMTFNLSIYSNGEKVSADNVKTKESDNSFDMEVYLNKKIDSQTALNLQDPASQTFKVRKATSG